MLAKNPGASVEQIEAALAKQGMSKSRVTIATIKSDFAGTYKALAAAGALKEPS